MPPKVIMSLKIKDSILLNLPGKEPKTFVICTLNKRRNKMRKITQREANGFKKLS
jgi:hypothetical protein